MVHRGGREREKETGSCLGLTDVGSVDEAEQVEQGDCGYDHEVNLEPQLGFGFGVDVHERVAVLVRRGLTALSGIMQGAIFVVRGLDGIHAAMRRLL